MRHISIPYGLTDNSYGLMRLLLLCLHYQSWRWTFYPVEWILLRPSGWFECAVWHFLHYFFWYFKFPVINTQCFFCTKSGIITVVFYPLLIGDWFFSLLSLFQKGKAWIYAAAAHYRKSQATIHMRAASRRGDLLVESTSPEAEGWRQTHLKAPEDNKRSIMWMI